MKHPQPLPLHLYTPDQLRRLGVALHLLARGLERVREKRAAAQAPKEAAP